ncbi:MAG: dNTP triphosphohydrolase [Gammaproteobacteria bacterium]|nr:dNTP triphosphohydrolase [Gammaproteobacteria bacterium]
MLNWKSLLNSERRKPKKAQAQEVEKSKPVEVRTQIERDYDRILFSTPVRRLADKTQVFPLERNDSVRTRLTHSHEVSNLARSIGVTLAFEDKVVTDATLKPERNLPSVLASIGLAHDLGNPPFGHQGEHAIQAWFADNPDVLNDSLDKAMKQDFLKFEGNAQTLRLLTRLQLINDDYGLNLTYATLAALMKYPTASDGIDKAKVASKKHGYFQSEKEIVADIWKETGLSEGVRHPLTYIMEACDDIAYAVLDAEDAVKKGLVSFSDLMAYLEHHGSGDDAVGKVIESACEKHKQHREEATGLSPAELNDISMQMFRVYAIGQMIGDVRNAYKDQEDAIMMGNLTSDLLTMSDSSRLCELLKKFDKDHAYVHRSVLEVELTGYNTIRGLMDFLWEAIYQRKKPTDLGSRRSTPFAAYAYNRISENYRRIFENDSNDMPVRYKELQLLTDMISGMTDSFALSLYDELKQYYVPRKNKENI